MHHRMTCNMISETVQGAAVGRPIWVSVQGAAVKAIAKAACCFRAKTKRPDAITKRTTMGKRLITLGKSLGLPVLGLLVHALIIARGWRSRRIRQIIGHRAQPARQALALAAIQLHPETNRYHGPAGAV